MAGDLFITGDHQADALLNQDGTALLIGMLLDQQVPMEWAFTGPFTLRTRLGHLDPRRIAAMPEDDLVAVACEKPAIHRFPAVMARRIHAVCVALAHDYDAQTEQVWVDVADGAELYRRLRGLPGFGDEKSKIFIALLAKRFGIAPDAWEAAAGVFADERPRTVADVHDADSLATVREWKRAQKAAGKDKQDRAVDAREPRGMNADPWCITASPHAWFTAFSGDANPIHDDPVAARRLLGGRMLVHGAHLLLRALDQAAGAGVITTVPRHISVVFRNGAAPDQRLVTELGHRSDPAGVVLTVTDADRPERLVATVEVDTTTTGLAPFDPGEQQPERPQQARRLDLDALARSVGVAQPVITPAIEPDACRVAFPAITAVLGAGRVAELAAISCVVGMVTPGHWSMSSAYDIGWRAPDGGPVAITHTVTHVDVRMRRVRMTVQGATLDATVTAFSPPAPVDQSAVIAAGPAPQADEFSRWRALVVGGSRGLGEAAARLLAAGGADVRITWCATADDARRVADELDIVATRWCAPGDEPAAATGAGHWQPTHVCWFVAAADGDPQAFEVEVGAFERLLATVADPPLTGVLWPSTAVLDEPPEQRPPAASGWVELKAAGEQACSRIAASRPGVAVHAARFPTLPTDRTQTLLPREYADTAREILAALRTLPRAADGTPGGPT